MNIETVEKPYFCHPEHIRGVYTEHIRFAQCKLREGSLLSSRFFALRAQNDDILRLLQRSHIRILNLFRISIILAICGLLLVGCATEYNPSTRRQDLIFYGTEQEVNLGRAIAKHVEKELGLSEENLLQDRVRDIGQRIVPFAQRKDVVFHFAVVKDEDVNAFALPGGYIFVNQGLMEKVASDDELACVLAHELAHISAKHSIKKLQASLGYSALMLISLGTNQPEVARGVDAAFTQLMLGYSKEDELLADKLAIQYAKAAGFDPNAMVSFLLRLRELNQEGPLRRWTPYRTHPYIGERIKAIKESLSGKIDFADYMNTL